MRQNCVVGQSGLTGSSPAGVKGNTGITGEGHIQLHSLLMHLLSTSKHTKGPALLPCDDDAIAMSDAASDWAIPRGSASKEELRMHEK